MFTARTRSLMRRVSALENTRMSTSDTRLRSIESRNIVLLMPEMSDDCSESYSLRYTAPMTAPPLVTGMAARERNASSA